VSGEPFPKASQLARGERRYRRKIASPTEWAEITVAKILGQTCRLRDFGGCTGTLERHHVVSRSRMGDDVTDNIVPLCRGHHERITARHTGPCRMLAASLSDAEYAYVVAKLGEGGMERLFGVSRGA